MTAYEWNVIFQDYLSKKARQQEVGAWLHGSKQPWLQIDCCTEDRSSSELTDQVIGMDYLYSGSCVSVVDGKEFRMEEGDLMLVSPDSARQIVCTSRDSFLVSVTLRSRDSYKLLDHMPTDSNPISAFLLSASLGTGSQPCYMIFRTGANTQIRNALENLMREYFTGESAAAEALAACYLREAFTLLWQESLTHPQEISTPVQSNALINSIVRYIRENCVSCTRQSVADHFGYSGSRISSLLREHLDRGFIDLRDEFRMELANQMLSASSLAVRDVAERCGYSNMSQFYKVYREQFHCLPRQRAAVNDRPEHHGTCSIPA